MGTFVENPAAVTYTKKGPFPMGRRHVTIGGGGAKNVRIVTYNYQPGRTCPVEGRTAEIIEKNR